MGRGLNRTNAITLKGAELLATAVGHSDRKGWPLNEFVTINWRVAGANGNGKAAQARFLELYRKWARYWGFTPSYVWAVENGPVQGLHSHLLLHVPTEHIVKFRKIARRWAGVRGPHSGSVKPIVMKTIHYPEGKDRLNQAKGLTKYFLSGIHPTAGELIKVEARSKAGDVVGKRIGTSRNLGRAARGKQKSARNTGEFTVTEQDYDA